MQTIATGLPGGAYVHYGPDKASPDTPILRVISSSGTQTFSFQEVFTGDKAFNQQFIRKDINPATPNVVGGNRDVLDFPMWFAMRANFTGDGSMCGRLLVLSDRSSISKNTAPGI